MSPYQVSCPSLRRFLYARALRPESQFSAVREPSTGDGLQSGTPGRPDNMARGKSTGASRLT